MVAMKRSASVLSSTAVSGDGVRTAASARAAGPRRWVRARGGCAVRGGRARAECCHGRARGGSRGHGAILPWRARHGALMLADGGASCQAHVG